ncbi:MAG: hypothetical protein P1U56_22615 [Saprospiraceae bacterium]|nr:hypothetical protein [Saprospiraceae bacterium]
MTERFKNNILQSTISATLFVGTGIVILAPQVSLIRKVSEYSVHIMLGMLLFSMLSMVFGKSKIMFAGLACTAALCVFLKNASHTALKHSEANEESKLNVAHINLGNFTYDFESIEELLLDEKIDVVSLQEYTPYWDDLFGEHFKLLFPYSKSELRIDIYGLAIYSRLPFIASETFMCDGVPNMNVTVKKENATFQVISSYLTPALDNQSLTVAAKQLGMIAEKVNDSTEPLIALGEYNMVYWTKEIRSFRAKTNLQNSRRDLVEGNFRVPYDHIFFSNVLECTQFKELKDQSQNYIGIMGTYQMKKEETSSPAYESELSLADQ